MLPLLCARISALSYNIALGFSVAGLVLFVLLSLYFAFCVVASNIMFRPKKMQFEDSVEDTILKRSFNREFLNTPFEEREINSDFGYNLYARLYINEVKTDKFILVLHGHKSNCVDMLPYAEEFLRLGYNVLIPDHRYGARSGGSSVTMGHYEKYDAISWINALFEEFPNCNLGVFGESMGGATGIMVTAMDNRVKFLIEYCGYANYELIMLPRLNHSRFLYRLLLPGLRIVATGLFNISMKEMDALSAMKTISVPVLMLHSKADKTVTYNNAEKLLEANPNAKLITFEESTHARSLSRYKNDFITAVEDFIKSLPNGLSPDKEAEKKTKTKNQKMEDIL
ncbi:MAG: alpha/beta hydrolase [Firmicutes bacterium]|nr:alpha/beta hydrolase [Bacillota bacterium]